MIAAYIDESFDPQPSGVFAVGGLLGRGVPIFELSRRWEKLRKRPDIAIEYFKASECEHGSGEFRKFITDPKIITPAERAKLSSIGREFLSTIVNPPYDKNYICIFGVGVVQSDFYHLTQESNARAILGDSPYRLAYDLAMVTCAWAMKELRSGDSVSFVCDEHEQYSPLARDAFRSLNDTNPNAAAYMGTFSSSDDKHCEPLQAADAAIFEIRRTLNLALGHSKGQLRKQFNILTDSGAMLLIMHTRKAQLDWIVANHSPGEPLRLDSVMEMRFDKNIKLTI